MKVALIGYYGKGNFGDDLLLRITYSLVRRAYPKAAVSVLCDTYDRDYFPRLLGQGVRIIRPGNRERFDLLVHGGGGTFFDYGAYGFRERAMNALLLALGYRAYVAFDRKLRAATARPRLSATRRIGWGIGVGTYVSGSSKLRDDLPALLDFDRIIVRDKESLEALRRVGVAERAALGSDLAFLTEEWLPGRPLPRADPVGRPRLGVILRDWPGAAGANLIDCLLRALPALATRFDLSFFVFDMAADPGVRSLAEGQRAHIWDPAVMGLAEYCAALAAQDVLVTSRAHGAICGAVLGVPSLILEIEPKLRTIHALLPEATRIISPAADILAAWVPEIERVRAIPSNTIAADVEHNARAMREALADTLPEFLS